MLRTGIRDLVLAAVAGVIGSWIWISLWGLAVAYLWFPIFQEHWQILGGGDRQATMAYAEAFDIIVSSTLAMLICAPLSYSLRGHRAVAWGVFTMALLLCVVIPSMMDDDLSDTFLAFFLSRPMTWSFVVASALAFWLGSVLRGKHAQA